MSPDPLIQPCPLCANPETTVVAQANGRLFLGCPVCAFVHVPAVDRVDRDAEHTHYLSHENSPSDPRYRTFLDRLALPLAAKFPAGSEGLDYGCGPGPALAQMLTGRGFSMSIYDPFFAPDEAPLERSYDFITCTETIEHFHNPAAELQTLDRLLRPGGWLGIMTEWLTPEREITGWRYARDPTHVGFFSEATLRWIADRRGWGIEFPTANVALFEKPIGSS